MGKKFSANMKSKVKLIILTIFVYKLAFADGQHEEVTSMPSNFITKPRYHNNFMINFQIFELQKQLTVANTQTSELKGMVTTLFNTRTTLLDRIERLENDAIQKTAKIAVLEHQIAKRENFSDKLKAHEKQIETLTNSVGEIDQLSNSTGVIKDELDEVARQTALIDKKVGSTGDQVLIMKIAADDTFQYQSPYWDNTLELFTSGYMKKADLSGEKILQAHYKLGLDIDHQKCPMQRPGFNVQCQDRAKARIGFCLNFKDQACESDDGDSDTAIGIGLYSQCLAMFQPDHSYSMGAGAGFTSGMNDNIKTGHCRKTRMKSQFAWVYVTHL